MNPIVAVQDLLAQENLLHPNAMLCCAVSGGADSMALLVALVKLQKQIGFHLSALHIQHGLRGMDSQEDEEFVSCWCRENSIPLVIRKAEINGSMDDPGIETVARDERRRIFLEELKKEEVLLLAHHEDDQAETVLMHLLRGAGTDGLCGMKKISFLGDILVLRPFLNVSKKVLLAFLEGEKVPHREDKSNYIADNPRNYLRLQVLPNLEMLFPGAGRHIAENSFILQTETSELHRQSQAAYQTALIDEPPIFALKREALSCLPEAILCRVLRMWVREGFCRMGVSADEQIAQYQETLALTKLVLQGKTGSVNLRHDMKVEMGRFLLCFRSMNKEIYDQTFCTTLKKDSVLRYLGCTFSIRQAREGEKPKNHHCVVVPPLYQHAVLRTPQPGDEIRVFGSKGHKEYRRFLTDIHFDLQLRRIWPVLAVGQEVLWAPGLRSSEALRLGNSTGRDLTITLSDDFFTY